MPDNRTTSHPVHLPPLRSSLILLILAAILDIAFLSVADAGSVVRQWRSYNYNYGTYGGGGGCPEGVCPDGSCAPLNSTCCGNGSYCAGSEICVDHGSRCLDRSSERVCSDETYCNSGYLCMNNGRCLSVLSDQYCGNGRYCEEPGSVCLADGHCRSQAAITAEKNARREREAAERQEEAEREAAELQERRERAKREADAESARRQALEAARSAHLSQPSLPPAAAHPDQIGKTQSSQAQPAQGSHLAQPTLPPLARRPTEVATAEISSSSKSLVSQSHLPQPALPSPGRPAKTEKDATSNGNLPTTPTTNQPIAVVIGNTPIQQGPSSTTLGSNSNANNVPTPCQDLTGAYGCQSQARPRPATAPRQQNQPQILSRTVGPGPLNPINTGPGGLGDTNTTIETDTAMVTGTPTATDSSPISAPIAPRIIVPTMDPKTCIASIASEANAIQKRMDALQNSEPPYVDGQQKVEIGSCASRLDKLFKRNPIAFGPTQGITAFENKAANLEERSCLQLKQDYLRQACECSRKGTTFSTDEAIQDQTLEAYAAVQKLEKEGRDKGIKNPIIKKIVSKAAEIRDCYNVQTIEILHQTENTLNGILAHP
jgi:hypothetical protein